MIRCAYLLSFDRDDSFDYKDFHNKLIDLPLVADWSHYVKSSYIIIAKTNYVNRLNEQISQLMGSKSYLLVKTDITSINGFLPQRAWDWFDKQVEIMPVESIKRRELRRAKGLVGILIRNAESFKIGKTGGPLRDRLAGPDYNNVYNHIAPVVMDSNEDSISYYESELIDAFIDNPSCDNRKDGEHSVEDRMSQSTSFFVYVVWR